MRFCIQANTHGIARRSATALPPRDAGREPMLSSPMTADRCATSWKTALEGRVVVHERPVTRRATGPRGGPISSSQAGSGLGARLDGGLV